ncbi:acyltransferase family protein [Reichenbachiella sp.]|uniref:acyltransferase family protein n=1 Tax=Reichenbachiella sp. TaxID=2184521 RepID=UPI003BAEE264
MVSNKYSTSQTLIKRSNQDLVEYLDGLRGIAAIIVILAHLRVMFFVQSLEDLSLFLSDHLDTTLLTKFTLGIISFFFDGNFAVYVFWVLSGYVISIKLFKKKQLSYLLEAITKRYFRLMFPSLASVLLAYLLLNQKLFFHHELAIQLGEGYVNGWLNKHYNFEANFFNALKDGIWDTFFHFNVNTSYNTSLWTMKPEFYGSLTCFLVFALFGTRNWRYYVYFVIFAITLYFSNYWLASFLVGFFLCDMDHLPSQTGFLFLIINKIFAYNWINIVLLLLILALAGLPNYFGISNLILSSLLIFLVLKSTHLQKVLRRPIFLWLGKNSFAIYLLHLPIFCSFTAYLYLHLTINDPYKIVLTILGSLILLFMSSQYFTKCIDKPSVIIANKIGKLVTNLISKETKLRTHK